MLRGLPTVFPLAAAQKRVGLAGQEIFTKRCSGCVFKIGRIHKDKVGKRFRKLFWMLAAWF